MLGWRAAMDRALYGPAGFFVRGAEGPADHFRTSVHASPLFAAALLRLVRQVDAALGHPDTLDVVDVGAGRGELLTALHALVCAEYPAAQSAAQSGTAGEPAPGPVLSLPAATRAATAARAAAHRGPAERVPLARRVRFTGVELAGRPATLPAEIGWRSRPPDGVVGLLLATEWLDNVPLDVAEVDADGRLRRVLVDPASGAETLGPGIDAVDRLWVTRWWPDAAPGTRIEIGWPRDAAWAEAVAAVRHGCALAVDYGHLRTGRPPLGTLTGYRGGRQVVPVPDGGCDVTAHVAVDSAAVAAGTAYRIISQRAALRGLGVDGGRPPIDLARTDPAGYLRALSDAGAAAELTDPAGLGGHWWLLHEVGTGLRGTILP
jgi:SAM-dependent MidA family methyltransferase